MPGARLALEWAVQRARRQGGRKQPESGLDAALRPARHWSQDEAWCRVGSSRRAGFWSRNAELQREPWPPYVRVELTSAASDVRSFVLRECA